MQPYASACQIQNPQRFARRSLGWWDAVALLLARAQLDRHTCFTKNWLLTFGRGALGTGGKTFLWGERSHNQAVIFLSLKMFERCGTISKNTYVASSGTINKYTYVAASGTISKNTYKYIYIIWSPSQPMRSRNLWLELAHHQHWDWS